jgi:hypothetical protein
MHTDERGPARSANLESSIKQAIVTRTGGRIRSLEVEVMEGRVVILGRAARYYDLQLALQAVIDLVGKANGPRIELNIDVVDDAASPEAKSPVESHNRQHFSGRDSNAHPGGHTSDCVPLTVGNTLPRFVIRPMMSDSNCSAPYCANADVVPMDLLQVIVAT